MDPDEIIGDGSNSSKDVVNKKMLFDDVCKDCVQTVSITNPVEHMSTPFIRIGVATIGEAKYLQMGRLGVMMNPTTSCDAIPVPSSIA